MASFDIPTSPKKYEVNLTGLLGVDFTSDMSDIDTRRSPEGYNFINKNGTIEKRNGYKVLAYLGQNANINGIWNVDTVDGEYFVVHCGTQLCEMRTDFTSYTVLLTGLKDTISQGIIINSKLLILDGKRAIMYDLLKQNDRASYLDESGYIPTTHIARSPDGLKDQVYEGVNLLQPARYNQFISTEDATVFQLADTNINSTVVVEVLNNSGTWVTKVKDRDFSLNTTKGTITFFNAIGNPPVDGRDNVRVKYSVTNTDAKAQVNKCSISHTYGYGGANNRAFISGNPDYPNLVMYSGIDDVTYIPVENVVKLGLETVPITGFVRTNSGKLAALKEVSDSDSTIFYLGYGTFNSKEVFPLEGSTKGEGNISAHASDTLINEPLILTRNGVFALNSATINDERFTYHRSYYVDKYLLNEPNLEQAVGAVNDGKYYLAINDNVYVADSRFKSKTSNSRYSNYQYEWFYWTGIPVRVWFVWNNRLYFGDKHGNLCVFRDDNDNKRYYDDTEIVKSYWSSAILTLGNISKRKNLKQVVISSNPTDSELWVGYKLKNGEKAVLEKVYIDSKFPKITRIRKQAKKLAYISIYIENESKLNMSFNSLSIIYTIGSYYRGD